MPKITDSDPVTGFVDAVLQRTEPIDFTEQTSHFSGEAKEVYYRNEWLLRAARCVILRRPLHCPISVCVGLTEEP